MLKALELVGFKSFADKTRFEFPPGITVVVGPNGSGKSNVVDAIKWVLGEQSVKSLHGKEMADVIFAGSGGRHALNAAETTLTFNNSQGLLAIDTPEVHVTRRVYRSGEGEYLINRQPCRLRDIRDLFAGTGVGTEAYSIIEQGKVDVLLQASSRDRRVIFEEAAGISRFKAKKVESLRRLERVEQNLLRLADIVEEVEARLRSVRLQAAKARRYRQCADRLQELRTQAGLADWRRLSEELNRHEGHIQSLGDEAAGLAARAEAVEARLLALDVELADTGEALRACEAQAAQDRERIAAQEATIEHQRARSRDLEEEMSRSRRQLATLGLRAGDLDRQVRETAAAVEAAEAQHGALRGRLAEGDRSLAEVAARMRRLRQEADQARAACVEQARTAAALANQISACESQAAAAAAARQRGEQRLAESEQARAIQAEELASFRRDEQDLAAAAEVSHNDLALAQRRVAQRRRELAMRTSELGQMRERHTGLRERAALLDELEQRLEGHSQGVKEVMRQARGANPGPYRQVLGLVAELFHVRIESAPLIEVALGEATGHVVVAPSPELVAHLEQESHRFQGRVGFVRLDAEPPLQSAVDLDGTPGVLGRADRFVETAPQFARLRERLLGRTWVVETLTHAVALAEGAGRGAEFRHARRRAPGRRRHADLGPRQTTAGLISRRSELRFLREQAVEQEARIHESQARLAEAERQLADEDQRAEALASEHQQAQTRLAEQRMRVGAGEVRLDQLERQLAGSAAERAAAETQLEQARSSLTDAHTRREQAEARLADVEQAAALAARQLEEQELTRHELLQQSTVAQVELAKSEERLEGLRARARQFEQDQYDRRRAVADCRAQLAQAGQRVRQAELAILGAESAIAELYLHKEASAGQITACINRREAQRARRNELAAEVQQVRDQVRATSERLHSAQLAAGQSRLERGNLASRLRDDYGVELADLEQQPSRDEVERRDEVDQEIAELRRKLNGMGSVNLDALQELDTLEARFATLSSQHKDLSSAKASLEQIIGRINADSRRLFAETLEAVREHFQSLFRKLFGGGQADIVLEEGVDILDSGVEIVARPPGKELRSISLLSGGEKTLTCVALLLAIFRSRPSPFCVLDEVDAALDEANIERFIGVLKEFLTWTQFIVVTHSKKTMTCANTLYGVTMQESGISKRVSVRFEDVSDNGEIRPSAATTDEVPPAADPHGEEQAA